MLFKTARKTENLRILQGELNRNVVFCVQFFFKIVLFENYFVFKIVLFKIVFSSKSWILKFILIQNPTRCKDFIPKSEAL